MLRTNNFEIDDSQDCKLDQVVIYEGGRSYCWHFLFPSMFWHFEFCEVEAFWNQNKPPWLISFNNKQAKIWLLAELSLCLLIITVINIVMSVVVVNACHYFCCWHWKVTLCTWLIKNYVIMVKMNGIVSRFSTVQLQIQNSASARAEEHCSYINWQCLGSIKTACI